MYRLFNFYYLRKAINISLLVILGIINSTELIAQISVAPNNNAQQLAQTLVGPGVVVSNATLTGSSSSSVASAGTFTATNSNLPFANGVVLSSGLINTIPGVPGTDIGNPTCGSCGDADLDSLSGNPMLDVVVLEFDVLPISDTLKFNYIFASEEYPGPNSLGYVCQSFNDVFGFFISGPGISGPYSGGSVNIALIPNTTTPVGINTINPGGTSCPSNSQYYNSNTAFNNTFVFNGYTTILQAKIPVVPCQTYRLKLKIGDAGDYSFDSGVFIQGGSLTSSGVTLSASSSLGGSFTNAVEGCLDGIVTFTKTEPSTTDQTIKYLIGGTAINGLDYQLIPDSIIIPAGQTTASINILPIADNIPEGLETIKISITEPCQNNIIDSVTLTIQDSLMTQISGVTNICPNTAAGLNISGAVNFTWAPASTLNNPNIPNPIATPSVTTTYTVTSTVGNCTAIDTITVNVKPIPPLTAGPDTILCFNAPVTMFSNAPTAVSRVWSPPVYLSSNTAANPTVNLPTGVNSISYIVTVTDNVGCKNRDTVKITIDNMSGATVSADTTICAGDTATLTAGGGTFYRWSPAASLDDSTLASPKAFPSSTTTYTVRAFNAGGCFQDKTVTVNIDPIPVANAGSDITACMGSTVTLNGSGSTTGNYSWSPASALTNANSANPTFTPPASGTSTFTLTVSNGGCSSTDEVTVTTNQLDFLVTDGDTTICGGTPVPLTATGGNIYSWTPAGPLDNASSANPTAVIYSNTTFFVTATDINGCTDMDSVNVTLGSAGTVIVSPQDSTICAGESIQFSASGGTGYSWSPVAGLNNPNVPDPIANPSVSTDYILTTSFINGCSSKDTIKVTVESLPIADAGADVSICGGNSVTLNGSGGQNFLWSPATGLSDPTIQNPAASPASTSTYTLTVTSSAGCTATDEVTVSVGNAPIADAGADTTICNGSSVKLNAAGGASYSWLPATGLDDPTISGPTATPTATTTYTVTVTNTAGCSSTDQVTVTVNNLPTVQAGPASAICLGDSVQLTASGGTGYSWSPSTGLNNSNIADPMATPIVTTNYTVTVTDTVGCMNIDSVIITVHNAQTVTAGTDETICSGDSVVISASGGNTYNWSPSQTLNDPTIASPVAFPDSTTIYIVTATDANGCITTDSLLVEVTPPPVIGLDQGDTAICPGTTVQLGVSNSGQYQWTPATYLDDPSIATPLASPVQTITYNVRVTDINNCVSDTSITITIHPKTDPEAGPDFTRLCEGDSIEISASNGITYTWSPSTFISDPTSDTIFAFPDISTIYTVTIVDSFGCTYIDSLEVEVVPAAIANAGPDTSLVVGTSIVLSGRGNGDATWFPSTWLSNPYTINPDAFPEETITYILEVETEFGCIAVDTVVVTVKDESRIYIPTAFSPNGDGINDILDLTGLNDVELKSFVVFNRWGQRVFATSDINFSWDGRFNGMDVELGTYVFKLVAVGSKGEMINKQGTITLLR